MRQRPAAPAKVIVNFKRRRMHQKRYIGGRVYLALGVSDEAQMSTVVSAILFQVARVQASALLDTP